MPNNNCNEVISSYLQKKYCNLLYNYANDIIIYHRTLKANSCFSLELQPEMPDKAHHKQTNTLAIKAKLAEIIHNDIYIPLRLSYVHFHFMYDVHNFEVERAMSTN